MALIQGGKTHEIEGYLLFVYIDIRGRKNLLLTELYLLVVEILFWKLLGRDSVIGLAEATVRLDSIPLLQLLFLALKLLKTRILQIEF